MFVIASEYSNETPALVVAVPPGGTTTFKTSDYIRLKSLKNQFDCNYQHFAFKL